MLAGSTGFPEWDSVATLWHGCPTHVARRVSLQGHSPATVPPASALAPLWHRTPERSSGLHYDDLGLTPAPVD
jgi:hypothetical protein